MSRGCCRGVAFCGRVGVPVCVFGAGMTGAEVFIAGVMLLGIAVVVAFAYWEGV